MVPGPGSSTEGEKFFFSEKNQGGGDIFSKKGGKDFFATGQKVIYVESSD